MLTIREHRFPFLEKVGDWNRFNRNIRRHAGGKMLPLLRPDAPDLQGPIRSASWPSAGQAVNHLDEVYDGQTSDIWDNAYVIVDFAKRRAGDAGTVHVRRRQRAIRKRFPPSDPWARSNAWCRVRGGSGRRIWAQPPVPQVIVSPRNPAGPRRAGHPGRPGAAGGGRSQRIDLLPASGLCPNVVGAQQRPRCR